MELREKISTFFKGVLMGIAQTIPGVSGGTIAFITGIYEKLIYSIDSIDLKIPVYLLKGDLEKTRESIRDISYDFFVPLGIGIVLSMFTVANFMSYAISEWKGPTFSFFFGLIIASAFKIMFSMSKTGPKQLFMGLTGFLIAFFVSGYSSSINLVGMPFLFLAGFIAVMALILPGVSGSLLMLIIGQYENVMNIISNFHSHLFELLVFVAGGAVSLFSLVKVLSYLLDEHENITISVLTGLVFGSLRMPYIEIMQALHGGGSLTLKLGSSIAGVGLVFLLENSY